jgi:hypothetical protein
MINNQLSSASLTGAYPSRYASPIAVSSGGPATSSSRFTPNAFKHNGRVALALLPNLFVLASYGGSQMAAVLLVSCPPKSTPVRATLAGTTGNNRHISPLSKSLIHRLHPLSLSSSKMTKQSSPLCPPFCQVGFMGVYILDAMRIKEGAFLAGWATLALTNLAMVGSVLYHGRDSSLVLTGLIVLFNATTMFLTGGF